jgi:hypothetical protein
VAPDVQTHSGIAPDGRRVTISCSASLQDGWFWHARMTSKTLAIGVSVAGADYADMSIKHHSYRVIEAVSYLARPLVVAVAPDNDGYLVAWKSVHHCIVFGGAGSAPRLGDIVKLLDQFTIEDSVAGLVMRPQPGNGIVMWNMYGVKFSDAGMITLMPREESAGLIPDQPGLTVQTGTLWKKTLDNATGGTTLSKFLHVSDQAVAMINDEYGRDPDVTRSGQEALLSSLAVQWGG